MHNGLPSFDWAPGELITEMLEDVQDGKKFNNLVNRSTKKEFFQENLRVNYLTKCTLMARTGSVIAPFIVGVVSQTKIRGQFNS